MIFRRNLLALMFSLLVLVKAIADDLPKSLVRETNSFLVADPVARMLFSSDGKWLASGELQGRVIVRSTIGEREIIDTVAHSAPVCALSFSGDGHLFSSVGIDGSLVIWTIDGHIKKLCSIDTPISWIVNRSSQEFLFGSAKGGIFKWTERSPKAFEKLAPYPGKIATYTQPILKEDRDLILTDDGDVLEFDISQRTLKRFVSVSKTGILKSCISHNRKFLLTVSSGFDGSVLTFSDFKIKSIGKVEQLSIGISAKDKFGIFMGASEIGGPSFVAIRSLEDGEGVFSFQTPASYVMAVSPDGNMIAIGGAESQPKKQLTDVKVFDLTALWEKLE